MNDPNETSESGSNDNLIEAGHEMTRSTPEQPTWLNWSRMVIYPPTSTALIVLIALGIEHVFGPGPWQFAAFLFLLFSPAFGVGFGCAIIFAELKFEKISIHFFIYFILEAVLIFAVWFATAGVIMRNSRWS